MRGDSIVAYVKIFLLIFQSGRNLGEKNKRCDYFNANFKTKVMDIILKSVTQMLLTFVI